MATKMEQHYLKGYYRKIGGSLCREVAKDLVKDILLLASARLGKPAKELTVLDVGSGIGLYSRSLAKYVKRVVGVEPFSRTYNKALKINLRNLKFYNFKIEDFDTDIRFDLVLSLTTLEHMPDAEKSFRKIFKLMKPGGLIYLTAPNKLWPYENHYNLWFLSWLPLPLANQYMKIAGRGRSYEDSSYSKTYFGIKSFFNKFPCKYEFILPNPGSLYLGCGSKKKTYQFVKNVGIMLIKRFPILWVFSKGFILLIQKNRK